MIRHIVLWTLKPEAEGRGAEENAALITRRGEELRGKIPGLRTLELSHTFLRSTTMKVQVVLCSTHDDEAALKAYNDHPLHQEFSKLVGACRESREAVDYEI